MPFIPLMIDISNKRVVIVGGGQVAERRIATLVNYTTHIKVISPSLTVALYHRYEQGEMSWCAKAFEVNDIAEADLIIAATNDNRVNQQIAASKPQHALLNMTSKAHTGDVVFPSILRRGRLTLSISTNGASPTLTAQILEEFKARFDLSYEAYVDFYMNADSISNEVI
ncbi:NAD(P)-binding protein [Staphylococcus saprophyticus]